MTLKCRIRRELICIATNTYRTRKVSTNGDRRVVESFEPEHRPDPLARIPSGTLDPTQTRRLYKRNASISHHDH